MERPREVGAGGPAPPAWGSPRPLRAPLLQHCPPWGWGSPRALPCTRLAPLGLLLPLRAGPRSPPLGGWGPAAACAPLPPPQASPSSSPRTALPVQPSAPSGPALPHATGPYRGATRSSNGSSRAPPERDQPMTQRALAVLVVASGALIVYFVIRTVRKRNKKTRRYGVLDTNIENMELTPLEQDDDDDDTTLFDANHPRRLVFRSSMYS
uniref:Transmembrane protein 157 n=1 Tax=Chrysemys picta bellii TaxID=8478 RepID=A0A8C3ILR7_CHRPI